jgi:prepilin-type N-terminal cleavage/methylation domain-containing protein
MKRPALTQQGFTLVEIAVVLLLIAIAGLVVFTRFTDNRDSSNINTVAADLSKIAVSTAALFPAPQTFVALGTVSTANCGILVTNGLFQGTSIRTVTTPAIDVRHVFDDGTVACGAATLVNANDGFTIAFNGLRDDVCSKLVRASETNARRVRVNGNDVKPLNGQINPGTVGTNCTTAASVNNQTVAFDFGR